MTKSFKHYGRIALRSGAAPLALGTALIASPSFAQTAPASDNAAPAEEIVVTGSLLRRIDTETASPVTQLTTESLTKAGITNINDAIRSISADGAGSISTGFQSGFSAGGAAVSLRSLGVSSTLVLIDGLRSTNFPINDDGHNAYVDLNSIPFSAVERVEVLKDGASSIYGADAIGGVVNIIMKKQFNGVAGTVEAGVSAHGDAPRYRANLTAGFGDYDEKGWNFYVNGEYQKDGRVAVKDRAFPYNTNDLTSIGGIDNNPTDNSLAPSNGSPSAVVRLAGQSDLNNPFSGGSVPTGTYTTLGLGNCPNGTFTVAGAAGGTGCRYDLQNTYSQIQPDQERYSVTGRLSVRISDNIEGYVSGSFSRNIVDIRALPAPIRQQQPYGASPAMSSTAPGVVLPVYICSAGINCVTAADRRLNPNNPYAAAFANDPAAGAARIYYRFGDIPVGTHRQNEVLRAAAGLRGSVGDDWNWQVDAVAAKDNLDITNRGVVDIAGLKSAINTGAYNFVNPALNTQAVRDQISPTYTTHSYTSMVSLDASVSKSLMDLPGGPLQIAVGGQVRHEVQNNPGINPDKLKFANTAASFGKHTVSAGYFEISAPVLDPLELTASGRYDHYSEGFSRFSPKIGATFKPMRELLVRGTWSKGFRAPTFAESNPRSNFPGFVTVTPPESFQLAHGGLLSAGNTNPYAQAYSTGQGVNGNPNLKPEKSRSFTAGIVAQPVPWLSFTVDYYNVKKTDVIVTGPDLGAARAAYFAGTPLPEGYTVAAIDGVDPLFPTALPRVLVISAPYVNAASQLSTGLDFSATANVPLGDNIKWTSRIDVTDVFKYNVTQNGLVQKYVGTMGPYELSSGAGTPKWRGNWQNTLQFGKFSLTATTYYVSKIKNVAADEGEDLSCEGGNLYGTGEDFCHIRRFIYSDLNASLQVNDKFTFYINVGNFTNAKAPIAPSSYSGINYLPTWHYAGVIGRTFRVGANFGF
ncbi:TonB-dependent receptor plug domain-containing protein [Sphingomonas quercus]|uniref:TonB-dependent receptor n=1 Tax=Sphingomonas quercus TaxID=2842451 RepID=A0ABS6BFU3_9SPHN|nr:TonB-dependent receptor [Sphingomonas quercus]MBU3077044.1 TonB-dependent receptor [Sphingomonas quercus]